LISASSRHETALAEAAGHDAQSRVTPVIRSRCYDGVSFGRTHPYDRESASRVESGEKREDGEAFGAEVRSGVL
jgi:hypothetical protein